MEYDDQPLDLSLPKKKDTMMSIRDDSFFNDIDALVVPKRKKYPFRTTNLEDPAALERRIADNVTDLNLVSLSTDSNGSHTDLLISSGEKSSFVEEAVTVDNTNAGPVEEKIEDKVTSATEAVATFVDDDDDDDNYSCTSGISLFAPSLSDILDSDREDVDDDDSMQVTINDNSRTNGWHPETNGMAAVSEVLEVNTVDGQIKKMFSISTKNSPIMVSPIHDPIRLAIESRSNTKRQLGGISPILQPKIARSNGTAKFDDVAERMKCESSLYEETAAWNRSGPAAAPSENVVEATTKIDASEPVWGVKFRSKIDFENLENITINVADANSTRIVSMPNANSQLETDSQTSLFAELELYIEQINALPVYSTPPRFQSLLEEPLIIQTASAPIDSVQNVPAEAEPSHGTQSGREQSTTSQFQSTPEQPLTIRTASAPIDSVQAVKPDLESALTEEVEPSYGMQSVIGQSTKSRFQPAPEQPLISQTASAPIDAVQNVATHMQFTREPLHRIQSVPIQSARPQFGPSAEQPLILQSALIPQSMNSFQQNLVTSSPKWRPDYGLDHDKRNRYISATLKLFENPCINSLENRPCERPSDCPYNHQLPNSEKILKKMQTFPNEKIHFIYQTFITKSLHAFVQYFPWICYLFGYRRMEETLVASVRDCDKYQRYDLYKFIFGGLLMCGKTTIEALTELVEIFDISEDREEKEHQLLEIMKHPIYPFPI